MNDFKTNAFFSKLKKQLLFIFFIWTIAVLFSLRWNINRHYQTIQETALYITRTAFEKDILYRGWVASHGGVYVPVDAKTPPNPYLGFMLTRDFSVSDKDYTLINPAYMTRQVFDLQSETNQVTSHITGLKPINIKNAAYPFEVKALQAFENGQSEYYDVIEVDGEEVFFYMQALYVEESCLACHERYGEQVGQVRGGISEIVRLRTFRDIFQPQYSRFLWMHTLIYFIGIFGLVASFYYLRINIHKQLHHEKQLLKMGYFDPLTGLYSRSFFEQFRKDNKDREMVSIKVVYFDVDGLKQANDQYGHAAGDELLQRAAEVIRQTFRDDDIKVRLSGDEFVTLLLNAKVGEAELAERINRYIQEDNQKEINKPVLDISFGFSNVMGFQKLGFGLQQADAAMYQQKQAKKAAK